MSEAVRRWRSDEINRKVEQKKKILAEVQSSGRNVSTKTMKKYNVQLCCQNKRNTNRCLRSNIHSATYTNV